MLLLAKIHFCESMTFLLSYPSLIFTFSSLKLGQVLHVFGFEKVMVFCNATVTLIIIFQFTAQQIKHDYTKIVLLANFC